MFFRRTRLARCCYCRTLVTKTAAVPVGFWYACNDEHAAEYQAAMAW